MVQNTERLCQCGFNVEYITDYAFQCFPDSVRQVTFRAKLHGTAHATSSQLTENIQQWVSTKIPVAVQGVRVNIDKCPVAITSFGDPQCPETTQPTLQSDSFTSFQTTPEMPFTSMETASDSITTETALLDTADNTGAIVGGVVAIILILAMTVLVITIAVLVTKNHKYKYSTDQAAG